MERMRRVRRKVDICLARQQRNGSRGSICWSEDREDCVASVLVKSLATNNYNHTKGDIMERSVIDSYIAGQVKKIALVSPLSF